MTEQSDAQHLNKGSFRRLFAPPVFEDADKTLKAELLNILLLAIILISSLLTITWILLGFVEDTPVLDSVITGAATTLLALVFWLVLRTGRVRLSSFLLVFMILINTTVAAYYAGSIRDPIIGVYVLNLIIASLLISARAGYFFTILSLVMIFGLLQAESAGMLHPATERYGTLTNWVVYAFVFVSSSLVMGLTMRSFDNALGLMRTANLELRQAGKLLEKRVAEHTRALEISTEISQRLSTILDPDFLVKEVVEQLRDAIGYYHAQIYLFDDEKKNLVMVGGTGESGAKMLADGHSLPLGKGLVGQAAELNTIVRHVAGTRGTKWLPNPMLPDTQTELAVPIAIGKDVVGVLDIHDDTLDGLGDEDAKLVLSIANQVAVALQNSRAYDRAQKQADKQALIASIGQRIQGAVSIDDALQIAVRELGEATSAKLTQVELNLQE